MQGPARRPGHEVPIERFKPTNGIVAGWCGLSLAAVVIAYVALADHSLLGLRVGLGAAFGGVLVWATQLRPRVTAYPDALLMRGTISDLTIPYVLVDEVTMGQTLNVWAKGRRYVCVGIGRSLGYDVRQQFRGQRSGGLLGENRVAGFGADYTPTRRTELPELRAQPHPRPRRLRPQGRLALAGRRGAQGLRSPGAGRAGPDRDRVRDQPAGLSGWVGPNGLSPCSVIRCITGFSV